MLQSREYSKKLKSFSDENFTDVKEKEFTVQVGCPIPLRARSDGELTKTSCNSNDSRGNGSYINVDEYILFDNGESSTNHSQRCDPAGDEDNYSWVLLPSNVDSADIERPPDAETVNGTLESNNNEDKVTESNSSSQDKLRKLSSDIKNNTNPKLLMTPQMDKPKKTHNEFCAEKSRNFNTSAKSETSMKSLQREMETPNGNLNLKFFDDHYKHNETKRLYPKSINEVGQLSEKKEAKRMSRPNIGILDKNIETSREKITNDNISLVRRPNSVNEVYHHDSSTLIDTCPDVNRYIPLSPVSCTTAQTSVVKPLALHPLAQTKTIDSYKDSDDPAGLGLEILPPQSIKYENVDLIQLSSSSSLALESCTSPADNEEDQRKGLDRKLPTDSEFVCDWPFLNSISKPVLSPIKATITDENSSRFDKDVFEPVKSQQSTGLDMTRNLSLPGDDKGIHLIKHSEKGVAKPHLLSFPAKVESAYRDLEVALHSSDVEDKYETTVGTDLGSDKNEEDLLLEMKETNTDKKSEDQESREVTTPPLNSSMDKDLINFFTQDGLSSSPSSLSRDTNEEADREVADIMGQESDDYFIEFKSESSNDWSVSSADSDVMNLNLLKLRQCKGMLIHDQPTVVPSQESLPKGQTPEEVKVNGIYDSRTSSEELSEQSNHSSAKNDSQLCNNSRKILANFMNGEKSRVECLSEEEKETINKNTSDNHDSAGFLENYEKSIDQPKNIINNIHTLSNNEDSTHQRHRPSEEEKAEETQRHRTIEKVSSESLLDRLPNVPDFIPSHVKEESGDEITTDIAPLVAPPSAPPIAPPIAPPTVFLDIRKSLNEPTVSEISYPSPDIYAKVRFLWVIVTAT